MCFFFLIHEQISSQGFGVSLLPPFLLSKCQPNYMQEPCLLKACSFLHPSKKKLVLGVPHGKGGFWCLWNAMEELHAGCLPWWKNAAASERGHALLGYSAPYPREMLGWLEVIVLSGKSQKSSSRRWQHSLQWAFLLDGGRSRGTGCSQALEIQQPGVKHYE